MARRSSSAAVATIPLVFLRRAQNNRALCLRRQYEIEMQPAVRHWLEDNAERGEQLTEEELDELLSLNGVGGPLTTEGVEHYVKSIERKRALKVMVATIADTELVDVLEKMLRALHEQVQPYKEKK